MKSLVSRSDDIRMTSVQLPSGASVTIRTLVVAFGRATPDRLERGVLAPTYTSKPLVNVGGDTMFGELAIVRTLEQDGWEGVWVDTFHGRKFWRAMPDRSKPVTLPPVARARYDAIVAANTSDGKGYVGSAYGESNLYGRWVNYAARGHGGNRLLRQRDPRNFRFTILQLVAPVMDAGDVIRLEASWKERLHTREPYGLNDN